MKNFLSILPYVLSIAADACLIFYLWAVWLEPSVFHVDSVRIIVVLIVTEFVMIFSSAFMTSIKSVIYIIFAGLFFGVFIWMLNLLIIGNLILQIYCFMLVFRLWQAIVIDRESASKKEIDSLVVRIMSYFAAIWIVVLSVEVLPEFGLTREYLEVSGYFESINASGVFVEKPHTALVFSLIYTSFIMYAELRLMKRVWRKNRSLVE